MKELGNNLAQLAAIIIFMIILAVSTATLSLWAGSDASADGERIERGDTASPAFSASAAR
ncbi:MAG TPA: hypothetical protein VEY11_13305 [Pyrinomonadaceae bacterium]|nr:hypothetical protein [Pyrinomonadaceae bacterium]